MTSLVIIFSIFLRMRSFIQQMRLVSLQMRKMRRNLLILSIQQRNNIQCHTFQVYLFPLQPRINEVSGPLRTPTSDDFKRLILLKLNTRFKAGNTAKG